MAIKNDFKENDTVSPEVINAMANACNSAEEQVFIQNVKIQNLVSTPDVSEANKVGNVNVFINEDGKLVFQNLKGQTGATGERGMQGEKGEKGTQGVAGKNAKINTFRASVSNSVGTPSVSTNISYQDEEQTIADINIYFENLKGDKGESGKIKYHNTYSSNTTYYNNNFKLDIVQYNGSTYAPKESEVLGHLPTETAYWGIIASKTSGAVIEFDSSTGVMTITV